MKKSLLYLLLGAAALVLGPVSCSDSDEPQQTVPGREDPDPDPDPENPGVERVVLTAGEWMYYGPFGESREDIYFLSLKNDLQAEVYYNMGFYVNVPTVVYSSELDAVPVGTYLVSDEQIPGRINNDQVAQGRSFWWTVDPEMVQHLVVSGSLTVAREGGVYTITGTVMEDETHGVEFSYTGELPVTDYSEKQWPNQTDPTHASVVLTEGELMYYGPFEQSREAVYYLYLKHVSSTDTSYFMGFYVNTEKAEDKKNLGLAPGRYTSASTWEVGTFTDSSASKKSFWYTVDSEGTRLTHYVKSGEFDVTCTDQGYVISGTVCEEDENGTLRTLDISFAGALPAEDYSDSDPDPVPDPEPDPDPDPVSEPVVLSVGELAYYGVENGVDIYYLRLMDQKPMKDYGLTLYVYLPAEGNLQLGTGDYGPAGADCGAWSFGDSLSGYASFWNSIDPVYGDSVRNTVTGGKLHVERTGDVYEISGDLEGLDSYYQQPVSLQFVYSGELSCEDWS